MKWREVVAWLPGIPIAIANGILREVVYKARLDDLQAHQLSVVSFILLFGVYVWLVLPWLKLSTRAQAAHVGLLWLVLTVAFEFLFGHYAMGHSLKTLLHDYNIASGRLWILVLLWIAIAPYIGFRLRMGTGSATAQKGRVAE